MIGLGSDKNHTNEANTTLHPSGQMLWGKVLKPQCDFASGQMLRGGFLKLTLETNDG